MMAAITLLDCSQQFRRAEAIFRLVVVYVTLKFDVC